MLLVGCANIANLQLARAAARGRELAIRVAIGAGRARLVSQLLTESTVLAILAGIVGVAFAAWISWALIVLLPAAIPRREEIGIDRFVLLFALAVSVATGILTGIVPAFRASFLDPIAAVRGTGCTGGLGRRNWIASFFIVLEIAFSVVLLVGAGLLTNSFVKLMQVKPGFRTDRLLTADFDLGRGFGPASPGFKYGTPTRVKQFYRDLLHRIRTVPGVTAAGTISGLPIWPDSYNQTFPVSIEGQVEPAAAQTMAGYYTVSPGLFETLGIPLVRGRLFTDRDTENAAPVVVVSQSLVNRLLGGADPTGRRMNCGPLGWRTIIGVVGDVRVRLDLAPPLLFYGVFAQMPDRYSVMFGRYLTMVARTHADPLAVAPMVRPLVHTMDPALPVNRLQTMEDVISDAVAPRRFDMAALGLFALASLAMATAGVYGVTAYTCSGRLARSGCGSRWERSGSMCCG